MAVSITVSVPRPAPSFAPAFVAIDRNFLSKEGLSATLTHEGKEEDLISGEVDFLVGRLGHIEFMKGVDLRMICGLSTEGGSHVLVVRSEFDSVKQLREVTVAAEENVMELRNILAHYGVDLDSSGIKTPLIEGSHPKQFEAMKRGVGDGAMLGAPWWLYAVKEGYKNMGSGSEYGEGLPQLSIYVAAAKIAQYPDQVRGFVRAFVKSMKYCHENVTGTLETIVRYSDVWGVDNLEVAKMVYDIFIPHWSAEVDIDATAKLLGGASQKLGKEAPPGKSFLDLRFLKEALSEI